MNLRHTAAALALVCWYLMMPSYSKVIAAPPITSGSRPLNANEAPINDDESPLNTDFSDVEKSLKAVVARNQWITKLPHVVQMTYGIVDDSGTVAIVVFVDKQENVSGVERKIPSKLEGFSVDVEEVLTIHYL